ncbi:MAG TPA: hypothetical protein PLS53_08385 [Thermoanaerobaculaceae bacterium]|nr:hypothetical protein [Thermoanaerobaculaceae bacterium]HPS78157.1 hypothetical protein [Thermoanaerobaculaceae bacterium]
MSDEQKVETKKRAWETPKMEVQGKLLDITAAVEGVGATDSFFAEGPSGG